MTAPHEPATCPAYETCPTCAAWESGYTAGKAKLVDEVKARLDTIHIAGCGCKPCALVRAVKEAAGSRALWEPAHVDADAPTSIAHPCVGLPDDFPPAHGGNLGTDY